MARPALVSFLFLVTTTACGGDPSALVTKSGGRASTKSVAAAVGAKQAKDLFESLCFTCHGLTGHGDGPGAAALNPKPRTFAEVAWQDSVTDDQITKAITLGGAGVGKSPIMPAQPQLKGQTEVLAGLVKIVRAFRGK